MAKTTAKYELGKEVLSYCGRCKMPLAHTILTLTKRGLPDRCECNTCGAGHKYRDPDKPVKPRTTRKRAPTVTPEMIWNEALADTKGPAKPYTMAAEFSQGDLMDHPTFGKGVVGELVGENKIKVIFEVAEKLLVHKTEL